MVIDEAAVPEYLLGAARAAAEPAEASGPN